VQPGSTQRFAVRVYLALLDNYVLLQCLINLGFESCCPTGLDSTCNKITCAIKTRTAVPVDREYHQPKMLYQQADVGDLSCIATNRRFVARIRPANS
jgi:hypothetical protein